MELKEKYECLEQKEREIDEKISALKKHSAVEAYISLCNQKSRLDDLKSFLYREIKGEEYSTCDHIWVTSLLDYDDEGKLIDKFYGCMKCGLDRSVVSLKRRGITLDAEQEVMADFINDRLFLAVRGEYTDVDCDLDLARAIYSRISLVHPGLDNGTARKYFEISLDHIRNIEVSEERTASRVKRLGLAPGFDRWGKSVTKK